MLVDNECGDEKRVIVDRSQVCDGDGRRKRGSLRLSELWMREEGGMEKSEKVRQIRRPWLRFWSGVPRAVDPSRPSNGRKAAKICSTDKASSYRDNNCSPWMMHPQARTFRVLQLLGELEFEAIPERRTNSAQEY